MSKIICDELEPRRLLAGNVTVTNVNGDLVVSGDAASNRIIVTSSISSESNAIDVAPDYIIRSADDSTTINGEFSMGFGGVTGSVRINLGAKADQVTLDQFVVGKDLVINGGRHGDTILLRDSTVLGSLTVAGNQGDDSITVLDSIIHGTAEIRGEGGHDLINLDLATFDSRLAANGGRGHDLFSVGASTFNAGKAIDGDRGMDKILTGVDVNTSFAGGDAQGWQAGFADYPVGQESSFELQSGIRDLPSELGGGKGFYLSGSNHSDDLFMFLKRKLGAAQGLQANTRYLARFEITFGSNAPSGCGGIGGTPGESVYLKAGGSTADPNRSVDEENHYRMTIDKGNQAQSGRNASNVSTIENGMNCDAAGPSPAYRSLRKTHVHTARVKTDAQGNLWIMVGTDSGFEGTTSLYLQSIDVRLVAVA